MWDQLLYRCPSMKGEDEAEVLYQVGQVLVVCSSCERAKRSLDFFLLSGSSASATPMFKSWLQQNWYMRYLDFWAVSACCFKAACLTSEGCVPLMLIHSLWILTFNQALGVGCVSFQDTIQTWRELPKFWFRFKFPLQLQKISMSSTHLFPLETNKMKNLHLKRVQLPKENCGEYSQQLKTGYSIS